MSNDLERAIEHFCDATIKLIVVAFFVACYVFVFMICYYMNPVIAWVYPITTIGLTIAFYVYNKDKIGRLDIFIYSFGCAWVLGFILFLLVYLINLIWINEIGFCSSTFGFFYSAELWYIWVF